MSLTKEQVKELSSMARLALTEEEINCFTVQINEILDYLKKLKELSIEGEEPAPYGVSLNNIMREDKVQSSFNRDFVLVNAPQQENFCFKVPKVLEED